MRAGNATSSQSKRNDPFADCRIGPYQPFRAGALLLNIPTSVCRRHLPRKGQSCLLAIERELTQSLLLPAGRTLRLGRHLRIGLRKPELPLRWSLRLRAIPCTVPCQGFHFPTIGASHHPLRPKVCHLLSRGCFVKKNLDNCGAWGPELLKKVVWRGISVTGMIGEPRRRSKDVKRLRRLRRQFAL